MKSTNIDKARAQVGANTPEAIIEMIATQFDRLDDARLRIEKEGLVVRDLKGTVISHPAIKIEQDAIKLAAQLIAKY